jgi:hypothetical protein
MAPVHHKWSSALWTGTPYSLPSALTIIDMKYVTLLAGDQHGGWTQEEDDVVLTVISVLLSLGWDIRQPAKESVRPG